MNSLKGGCVHVGVFCNNTSFIYFAFSLVNFICDGYEEKNDCLPEKNDCLPENN